MGERCLRRNLTPLEDPTMDRACTTLFLLICASCANLVADVSRRKQLRRRPSTVGIAVALIVAFAVGVAALVLGN